MGSITNGVHTPSWTSDSFASLYDEVFGTDWIENDSEEKTWQKISHIEAEHLWKLRCAERKRLIDFIKKNFSSRHWELQNFDSRRSDRGLCKKVRNLQES